MVFTLVIKSYRRSRYFHQQKKKKKKKKKERKRHANSFDIFPPKFNKDEKNNVYTFVICEFSKYFSIFVLRGLIQE